MPQGLPYGDHGPVPDQQDGDGGVREGPEPAGEGEIGPGELVAEGQGGGEVDEEVHPAPGFVADPSAYGPRGGHPDDRQQRRSGEGGGHGGIAEQPADGADHVDALVDGVSAQGEERVPEAEQQHVPTAQRVPAGDPVGAHAVLHRGHAGHQEEQDQHPVPGEQTGQVGAGREQRVEAGGGAHLGRPEQRHSPRPAEHPALGPHRRISHTDHAKAAQNAADLPEPILKPVLRNASPTLNPGAEVRVPPG